jgi:hypothetical protein
LLADIGQFLSLEAHFTEYGAYSITKLPGPGATVPGQYYPKKKKKKKKKISN